MSEVKYDKVSNEQDTTLMSIQKNDIELELGEYFLHVYISKTQDLQLDDISDIRIKISTMQQKQYSQVQKDVVKSSRTFWGEHFFFSKNYQSREELNNDYLEIQLSTYNQLNKLGIKLGDNIIGSFTVSLLKIYSSKDHVFLNEWGILINPQKSFRDIFGFLKISANFVRVGEPRANLEMLQKETNDKDLEKLEFPPNILINKKQIVVKLFRGTNLLPMDSFSNKADPFIKFQLGGIEIKSEIQKNTLNPIFNQKLFIPSISPSLVRTLVMKCYDFDKMQSNDCIGSFNFKMDDIQKNLYKEPRWYYIYGAYQDNPENKEVFDYMNEIPEMASRFKGQFLLSIEFQDIQDQEQKQCVEDFVENEGEINLEEKKLFFLINLEYIQNIKLEPEKSHIELNWGGEVKKTSNINYKLGVLQIYETIEFQKVFQINSKANINGRDIYDQLPDLILSVVQNDKYFCYKRFKPCDFNLQQNNSQMYLNFDLIADNSVSDMKDHHCGILSASLVCYTEFEKKSIRRDRLSSKMEEVLILCNIYQAKDLNPSDQDGTGDPLCMIYNLGSTAFTTILQNTLNPSWNQMLKLKTYKVNGRFPSIIIQIFDQDKHVIGNDTHDFMGQAIVHLQNENNYNPSTDLDFPQCKKWYDLNLNKNLKKGKILASFIVFDYYQQREQQGFLNTIQRIRFLELKNQEKTLIRLNILGLRNLQSCGIFPIKKVQVKIDLSSLRKSKNLQEGNYFNEYIMNAKEQGNNPTLGAVVTFVEQLSTDPNHLPTLSCRVIDEGLQLGSNLIGTFQIDLGYYICKTEISLLSKLEILKQFIEQFSSNKNELFIEDDDQNDKQNTIEKIDQMIQILERKNNINKETLGEINFQQIRTKVDSSIQKSLLTGFTKSIKNVIKQDTQSNKIQEERIEFEENTYFVQEERKKSNINYDQMINIEESNINYGGGGQLDYLQQIGQDQNKDYELDENQKDKMDIVYEAVYEPINNNQNQEKNNKKKIQYRENQELKNLMQNLVSDGQYQVIGYTKIDNDNKIVRRKQYRKVIQGSLDQYFLEEDFIQTIDINRGKKTFQKTNFWDRFFSFISIKEENFKKTGDLKAIIEIIPDNMRQRLKSLNLKPEILQKQGLYQYIESQELSEIEQQILKQEKVSVYVYVLKAEFVESQDLFSKNDSYFKIFLGKNKLKSQAVINNDDTPKYYEAFKMDHQFPGASILQIVFYDEDDYSKDDEIGIVEIDLERRFFNKKWRDLIDVPIERQDIIRREDGYIVGQLDLFIDILTENDNEKIIQLAQEKKQKKQEDKKEQQLTNTEEVQGSEKLLQKIQFQNQNFEKIKKIPQISQRPAQELEIRIVIWDGYDIPSNDFEDVSDLYVEVKMPSFDQTARTDTHYRAAYQFGSWNWRIIFKINIEEFNKDLFELDFFVFDKDLLSPNDYICHQRLNIENLIEEVIENQMRSTHKMQIDENKYITKIPLDMVLNNSEDDKKQPKLYFSIDVLTIQEAKMSPVGIGRGDPNQDPYLPHPSGRFEWSWNPHQQHVNLL